MPNTPCPRSDDTATACRTGAWEEALRLHAASCPDCQETMLVAGALRSLAEAPPATPPPDPGLVFRKAQILARFRQEDELTRRAMRPVRVAQWAAFAAALAGLAWAAVSAADFPAPAALGAVPHSLSESLRALGRLAGLSLAAALALAVALRLLWAEE